MPIPVRVGKTRLIPARSPAPSKVDAPDLDDGIDDSTSLPGLQTALGVGAARGASVSYENPPPRIVTAS